MDCSLPGSSVHGIFQARVLEWVAISFSRGSFWPRDQTWVSRIAGNALPSEPSTREEIEKVILKPPLKQTLASDGITIKFKPLKILFIFNWRIIALQYVLVSAIHQHELAIGIYVSPPSHFPFHSTHLGWQRALVWAPWVIDKLRLAIYFAYCNVHASMLLSQFVPPPPFPTVSTSLFSVSAPPLLPCKGVHQYHLSRVYIYMC